MRDVDVNGTLDYQVDISSSLPGSYYIIFRDGKNQVSKKIIIR
jgi:hypothetical protein